MAKRGNLSYLPLGVAAVVFLVVLILPMTRWLVLNQLRTAVLLRSPETLPALTSAPWASLKSPPPYYTRALVRVAERYPNDYQIQVGDVFSGIGIFPSAWKSAGYPYSTMPPPGAIMPPHGSINPMQKPPSSKPPPGKGFGYTPPAPSINENVTAMESGALRRLCNLLTRFPNNPALYATILEFASPDQVNPEWGYTENKAGIEVPVPKLRMPPPNPYILAWLDKLAAKGEKLDPQNAFFPAIRAMIRFTKGQKAAGLKMLERISHCSKWQDYSTDVNLGEIRLARLAFGRSSALAIAGSSAMTVTYRFSVYASLRSLARIAHSEAIKAEQRGYPLKGAAIRDAVIQLGGLMRAQPGPLMHSLVGIAISAIGAYQVNGISVPQSKRMNLTPAERDRLNSGIYRRYAAHLRKIGLPKEAQRVEKENADRQLALSIARRWTKTMMFSQLHQLLSLTYNWGVDIAFLMIAFWMLALSGIATAASRANSIQEKRPLAAYVRWSIGGGFLAAIITAAVLSFKLISAVNLIKIWIILGLIIVLVGVVLKRKNLWRSGIIFVLSIPGLIVGLGVIAISVAGVVVSMAIILQQPRLIPEPLMSISFQQPLAWLLFCIFTALFAALFLYFVMTMITSWRHRVPVSVGLVTGLSRSGILIAGLFMIAYGGAVLYTAKQEAVARKEMMAQVTNECGYCASLVHQKWPGPP